MRRRAVWSTLVAVVIWGGAQSAIAQPEDLRIRIENRAGGAISVSRTNGAEWLTIGQVVRPATTVNPKGYNASRWVPDSTVAATAVNAIHIKVRTDKTTGRGVIFSITPADKTVGAATEKPSASIITDVLAGQGIFGGLGPTVGSSVHLAQNGETLVPLDSEYEPARGDVLVITRHRPPRAVRYIDFENKFGGLITLTYCHAKGKPHFSRSAGPARLSSPKSQPAQPGAAGLENPAYALEVLAQEVIGQVLKPVVGIGRFEGTVYAAPGRLRANHAGVIDISTSPLGLVGGFQIVPRGHANDPEVWYIRSKTQWMVVGPIDGREPSWEGVPPLFAGYLYPSYRADDLTGRHKDWFRRVLSRCQVLAKTKGNQSWHLLPRIALDPEAPANLDRPKAGTWHIKASLDPYEPLSAVADTAVADITNIRIVLPREVFWPTEIESGNYGE